MNSIYYILKLLGVSLLLIILTACYRSSNKTQDRRLSSEQVYKKCNPSVFTIIASTGNSYSQGTGFFITKSGIAVSNYHVFDGTIRGTEQVYLSNNRVLSVSEIIEYDEYNDIIIFKVDLSGKSVRPLVMSNRTIVVGQKVYAIGSPLQMTNTFSSGEISQFRGYEKNIIQINVPVDLGSSGGPLINEYGEVIGITSSKIENTSANLNFAINIQLVKNMLPQKQPKKSIKKNYKIKKKNRKR